MAEKRETLRLSSRHIGAVIVIGVAIYLLGAIGATFTILGAVIWMALGLVLPTICLIGTLHTRGDQRTFFIGALFPAAITLAIAVTLFVVMTFEADDIENFEFSQIGLPVAWFLTIGCGALATGTARRIAASGDSQSTHSLWQFSLWSLMIAMTLCAIVCAILFVLPSVFSVSICLVLWTLTPVVVTVALLNGSAERRDFWVGAAFPAAAGFAAVTCVFVIAAIDDGPRRLFDDEDLALGLQIVSGLLAVSALLLGKLAAILGRRLRRLQEEYEIRPED